MSPSPVSSYQKRIVHLIQVLPRYLRAGELLTAPMDVRLANMVVQPDLFWIAEGGACVNHETYYDGPPDLIIEVLSPGNTENDRVTKYDLYESVGVREYWIIDPHEDFIEVYTLEKGSYRRVGAYKPGVTFRSPVLDCNVDVEVLFS